MEIEKDVTGIDRNLDRNINKIDGIGNRSQVDECGRREEPR